jgi:hypothetical protein
MNEAEVLQHVTKYSLPSSIEGTPRWHKSQLKDLLAMVDKFGMHDLFLTLTADEANSLRWKEIADIEQQIVQQIDKSMTWKDCPVECASLFHSRVQKFLHDYILSEPCILGHVKEYVIRYEIQLHGSLHAHIMLWIEHTDLERVANEITACVPTVFDSTSNNFIEPTDTEQTTLFKTVMRKQLHTCISRCHHKKMHGTCKYGFPFPPHTEEQTTFNVDTRRWDYYRPRNEDRNVVPYYATILLLWGAHINLKRINTAYWLYYLLKYAMKSEPHGPIQLDKTNAERLGLQGASNS